VNASTAACFVSIATLVALTGGCGAGRPSSAGAPQPAVRQATCEEAAHAHAAQERYAEAVAAARRCTELAPHQAQARDTLGEILMLTGDLDAAERAFHSALALHKEFALSYQGVASVRFHHGDVAGGEAALRAGIAVTPEIDPSYARTRLTEDLAVALFLANRDAEAFAAMADSVRAQNLDAPTTEAVTRVGRARLFLQTRRWAPALEELRAARVLGAQPYVDLAIRAVEIRARAEAGDVARAASALHALTRELGATHPRVLEPAFAVALAQGDLPLASSLLGRIAEADPYAGEGAELDLARALREAGQEREARSHFAKLARRYLRSVASAHVRRAAAEYVAARRGGRDAHARSAGSPPNLLEARAPRDARVAHRVPLGGPVVSVDRPRR
jgi:tetratricopeptide (TPR) repeat protein